MLRSRQQTKQKIVMDNLNRQIEARCPCFAVPANDCQCQNQQSDYEQMLSAIQSAYSWLQHAYKLMESQGITSQSVDNDWPIHLGDAVHYCCEALSELDPE